MKRILYALLGLALASVAGLAAGIGGINQQEPAVNSGKAGSASALNNYLQVTSIAPGFAMSGPTNAISGVSGRGLINVTGWYGGTKIGLDQAPTCSSTACAWTLNIDVTSVPAGAQTLSIIGFSQPAANGSLINNKLDFPITVGQAASASISYIGSSSASSSGSSGANCAPAVPTGTQPGDLILGYVPTQGNAPGNTPTGWNIAQIAGNNVQAINTIQSATLYYRIATGTGDAPNFTNLSYPACMLRTYRGVSATGPFDRAGSCVQTAATSCSISGLVATANNNEIVVAFYDFNINTATITGPSGFGNAVTDPTQRSVWSGDKTIASAGTLPGAITATVAGGGNYWDGVAVTLIATGGAPILAAPSITTQPTATTVAAGQSATFTAAANGYPTPTWLWQVSADSGTTWATAPGTSTNPSYTTPATVSGDNGKQYRAIATNSQGQITTSAAVLNISVTSSAAAPCVGNGGAGSGNCGTATEVSTAAVRANDFLNSMGINVGAQGGGQSSDAQRVTMFNYLGIRLVRGSSFASNSPTSGITMCQGANVRVLYILESGWVGTSSTWASREVPNAKTLAAAVNSFGDSCLFALEGANELDNWCTQYNGTWGGGGSNSCPVGGTTASWAPAAQAQRDWLGAARGDSVLVNYPMYSASHVGGENDNVGLQFIKIPTGGGTSMADGTTFADYANMHNYVIWGNAPQMVDNAAWNAASPITCCQGPGGNGTTATWYQLQQDFSTPWRHNNFAGYTLPQLTYLPRVSTETGWTDNNGGFDNQGKVALNVYLAQFKRGYKATFWYQLRDNEGGFNNVFGLFSQNSDGSGTAKLAATYIHNLTTILADRSSGFVPGSLPYSIASQPATVHDLLMQKSNGHMFLVLWDERPIGEATDNITVSLGGAHTGNVFDPTAGSGVQSTFNSGSLNLAMTDHPLIIELTDTQLGLTPPAIVQGQPTDQTAFVGNTVTFVTSVSGSPQPTCQWFKSNTSLGAGHTDCASETTPQLGLPDNGATYFLKATNSQGVAQSRTATLTVNNISAADAFSVTTPAANATVSGTGFPIVIASGSTWLNAACYFGPTSIKVCNDTSPVCVSGNCTFSLALDTTKLPDGTQAIGISGFSTPAGVSGWTSTSVNLQLNVCNSCGPSAPVIASGQPANQTGIIGGTVTFSASVSGNPAPTCQWSKGGVSLGASARVCGSLTYPLTGTLVSGDNGATFSLSATNTQGSATSRTATLSATAVSGTFDQWGLPNTAPRPNNPKAVPMIAFLRSIGTGIGSGGCNECAGTLGTTADNANLIYVGAQYLRENTVANSTPLIARAQTVGAKVALLTGELSETTATLSSVDMVAIKAYQAAGVLGFIEGPNEPDTGDGFIFNGSSCANDWAPCARFQHDLYALIRADSTLNAFAVSSISHMGAQLGNYGLQFANSAGIPARASSQGYTGIYPIGTVYSNLAAHHPYNSYAGAQWANVQWYSGNCCKTVDPATGGGGDDIFPNNFVVSWKQGILGFTQTEAADQINTPRVATEWNVTGDGDVGGIFTINTYLDYFNQGNKVNLQFSLVSPPCCGPFGMWRADGTKNPKADYLHSMTRLFADTADVPSPTTVNYTYSGCPNDTYTSSGGGDPLCHFMLLEKSTSAVYGAGHKFLAMTFEPGQGGAGITLNLNLGTQFSNIKILDITTAVTPAQNTPSNPTPVASCVNCTSISFGWNALGHSDNTPPPLVAEFW